MKAVRFKVSPPLPSYLVGLAVGRFQAVDAGRLGPTPIRIIVPRGQTGQASNAAIVIPQLLKFFEDYLASPFPYEKLDVLAMPIGESAVGNAGLIALPERKLLGNPARETAEHRRKLAESSAHQIAHQWFGGFVTAAWWNDTWLSEAFATWMQRKIPAAWRPEWGFDAAVVNARLEAMRLDRLFSARAVRQPIESNHDIANAFDGITREKGAAVIEMLEHWIGPERFRVGVRLYLKQHAWGNATGTDFASDMSNSAAQDIGPLLSGFLDQSGLPEIAMALKCGKPPSLEIRQERAQPVGSQAKPQLWRIPVCTAYVAGVGVHEDCSVVDTATADVDLAEAQACPAWLLPNDDVSGYYEIAYEGDLLERVLADGGRRLSVPERVGVLGDLNLQARAGDVPAGTVLSLVPRFSQENAPDVVETVAEIASLVRSNGMPGELREEGERFIRQQFGARALDLGWLARAGDSDDTRLLRQILVPLVASAGERPLIAEAGRLAGAWVKDRQAVTPEMSGAVLKVAAEFGDRELFNLLLSAATHERDHTVRHELLEALGSFRKPALATAALSQLLSKNFDPRESFPSLLFGPLADQETRGLPFEFVKRHLDSLLKILPRESDDDYAAVLPEVGRDFCDAQRRDQLQAFFADRVKDYTGGPRILAQTLEGIDLCVAARQRLLPEVTDFLKQQR
jgi:alanyl aminopeptidase